MSSASPPFANHAHARSRNVTAVLGPTNTGKTHLAIERMLGHQTGLIGLPLRLLAREVYDKVADRVGPAAVALITGEEKIKPENPRYYVCTVEAMPQDVAVDFLAIDEIQLAADAERGHVFTDRLFHARGEQETLLLGAATMREAIRDLLPSANIVSRPRLSTLSYAGEKKLSRLPRRTAVVAFSANEVYAIAELVRRQRGGAAVVLGALSPRTRNAQVALYQSGDVDFLIATDAIGMGLNLDVDHVAFAATRKFDGQNHRDLAPAELGQIAGRAGRHMNDGTFGVTGSVPPFESEVIRRLENHDFESVKLLQWRNRNLDFDSLDRLRDSLRVSPQERRLTRARMVDDVIALENLGADPKVRELAAAPAAVRMLWDVCQIPDYRKISSAAHAELLTSVYQHLMSDPGHIPEDWFSRQVEFAARTDGDIDTIANRIAHIRTWTFVSHRADWLARADHWQDRTREIEDLLSDALHERLLQRFVDRRTSTLMKRLRDQDELYAEIATDGTLQVEQHFVGRLLGFHFTPDASGGDGIHGKAARHAASKVLAGELAQRAERLAQAPDTAIGLTRSGRIIWEGADIARIERGETLLKPSLHLIADEQLSGPDREKVQKRLADWLERHLHERLAPLIELSRAEDVTGLARGIAFRLSETLGVLKREDVADEIRALDQEARGQLRRYGVRFGGINIFFPALLKPSASELIVLLWSLHAPAESGIDAQHVPIPPRQGLTSAEADPALPEAFYRAAGFHLCGKRVVRIDMLERLADMIRPLLMWKPTPQAPIAPAGATGHGGFRVQSDMMSIVGCSGEDFGCVLQALGFRRERRPIAAANPATGEAAIAPATETSAPAEVAAPSAGPATVAQPAELAPAEPQFDEIWRPRRKHREGQAPGQHRREGQRHRAKTSDQPREQGERKKFAGKPRRGKPGRGERPLHLRPARPPATKREKKIDPDSPFAALAELKAKLERPERDRA